MLQQQQSSLLDLPNELLFQVVDHVTTSKNLMLTCHRLYNIVYPHFLDSYSVTSRYPLIVLHWAVTTRNEPLFRAVFRAVPRLAIYDPDDPDWLRTPGWLTTPWSSTTVLSEYLDRITPRVMEKAKTIRLEHYVHFIPVWPVEIYRWGEKHKMTALGYAIHARKVDMVRYFTEVLDPEVMFRGLTWDVPFETAIHDWEESNNPTTTLILKILFKTVNTRYRLRARHLSATPLHWAASHSWVDEVKSLVSRGASFTMRDGRGCTPLMVAVNKGSEEVVKVLIELNQNSFLKQAKDVVAAARKNDNQGLARYMIVESFRLAGVDRVYGWSALYMAVKDRDEGLIVELLGKGVNVNAQDNNGRTPLHLAVNNEEVSTVIMMLLINNGAKVSAADRRGKTPLHVATNQLSPRAVRVLLQAGADVNAKDSHGNGPLEIAYKQMYTRRRDVMSILVDFGAVPASKICGGIEQSGARSFGGRELSNNLCHIHQTWI